MLSDFEKLSDRQQVTRARGPAGDACDDPDGTAEPMLPEHALTLFAILGKRWSAHVLYLLSQRPARFTQLQNAVPGLSATSLNDRLRDLASAGLVLRRTHAGGPPLSSSYEATAAGHLVGRYLLGMVADAEHLGAPSDPDPRRVSSSDKWPDVFGGMWPPPQHG